MSFAQFDSFTMDFLNSDIGALPPHVTDLPTSSEALMQLKLIASEAPRKYNRDNAEAYRKWFDGRLSMVCADKLGASVSSLPKAEKMAVFSAVTILSHMYYYGTPKSSSSATEFTAELENLWHLIVRDLDISVPHSTLHAFIYNNIQLLNKENGDSLNAEDLTDDNFSLRLNFLTGKDAAMLNNYALLLLKMEAASSKVYGLVDALVMTLNKRDLPGSEAKLSAIEKALSSLFLDFERGRMSMDYFWFEDFVKRTMSPIAVNGFSTSYDVASQIFCLQYISRMFSVDDMNLDDAKGLLPQHREVLPLVSEAGRQLQNAAKELGGFVSLAYENCRNAIKRFAYRNFGPTVPFIGRPLPVKADAGGKHEVEFVVVGAGPAGLQAAYDLEKLGRKYVVLEKADGVCDFFRHYPRHGTLISINKCYTGKDDPDFCMRHDWNSLLNNDDILFKHYSKDIFPNHMRLVQYMRDFHEMNHLNVEVNSPVSHIRRECDGRFVVQCSRPSNVESDDGGLLSPGMHTEYRCKYVLMATGARAHNIPEVEGIETATLYGNASLNKDDYKDKRVLILGKGNSAMEAADYVAQHAATIMLASNSHVKFAWDTHFVGHVRAVNNNVLDMYQLKSQVAIINGMPQKIVKKEDGRYDVMFQFTETPEDPWAHFEFDHIIVATGWRYVPEGIFDPTTCPIETIIQGRFPNLKKTYETTQTPNVYFIGGPSQGIGFKKDTSGFIHGFRSLVRTVVNQIVSRDSENPVGLPQLPGGSVEQCLETAVTRMDNSPSIFQMFDVLCDVIRLSDMTYFPDVNKAALLSGMLPEFADSYYVVVSLEYGNRGGVPAFDFVIQSTPQCPEKSWALHPILYLYNGSKLFRKIHLIEQIELEFNSEEFHVAPFRKFLQDAVAYVASPDVASEMEVPVKDEPLAKTTITYR